VFICETYDILSTDGSSWLQFCVLANPYWFNARAYAVCTFVLWYAVPLTMMTFVYTRISVVLWRSSHGPRLTSGRASPTPAATPPTTGIPS